VEDENLIERKSEIREMLFRLDLLRKKLLQPFFLSLGLSIGQGQPRILNHLLIKDDITQKELADLCDMDVTTISRTIDKLEEAELLERKRHPECRRSYRIRLTEEGRKKALQIKERFELIDDKIWEGFEEEEMEEVLRGLKKICKNLEEKEE
jgi:DNA-binding MarR family transcriptional regulator